MATLLQHASNAVRKGGPGDQGSVTCKATFDRPTTPGSMVVVVAFSTGGLWIDNWINASGFSVLFPTYALRDTELSAWYRPASPSVTSISVSAPAYRGMTVHLFEVGGIAQSAALDKLKWSAGENSFATSGTTSTLAQAGEYVFGVVANQYDTATQSGFSGGLNKLYETVIPSSWNQDWEKGRVTFHQGTASTTAAQRISANLSTTRRWISFVATFKSGISGPARMSVTLPVNTKALEVTGRANLTAFGPLKVSKPENRSALSGVEVVRARIGPFDYQYRLGGWDGLLIGAGTPYPVESVDGLEGWSVSTSDAPFPRSDGALRGVDLQVPRQVVFKLSTSSASGNRQQVEASMAALYAALIPQRETDSELIWRHPGRPLRTIYYRPTDLMRALTQEQALVNRQPITLRAADPRHYSAVLHTLVVPVSPDDSETVTVVAANNVGNARAYPVIRIIGPTSGPDVTRVALTNATAGVTFDVITTLQAKAELVGDMHTWITGSNDSVVKLNGQSKYGAWQMPRDPFYVAPDPEAASGVNLLYLRTVPTGAPVTCSIEWRDCWSG